MQEKFILLTFAPMNNTAKIWAIAALSLGTSMHIGANPLHPLVINLHDNNISLSDTTQVVDLDEVVVVSQPKEVMRLRQQPLSSSVFTTKELADLGVDNISGLSAHVPSFVMPDYGSRLTSSLYIRGIGSRIGSSAVGIYVDGIPLVNKSAFNMHLYQLDRIDILRGPQGTLYGMNNEGGLLRMFTKNAMNHQGTDITLGLSTHFGRQAEATHYFHFGDKVALAASAFYNGSNGYFRNAYSHERADDSQEAGGRVRLTWQPNARLTANLMADFQHNSANAFPYGVLDITDGDITSPQTNRENSYRRNMLNTGFTLDYTTKHITLNATTSYQHLKDCMRMDQDYQQDDFMHLVQRQRMNALTQEISVKSRGNGKWQWSSGVYGAYQWLHTDGPVFFDEAFTSRISSAIQQGMYNGILNAMAGKMMQGGMPQEMAMQQAAAAIAQAGGVSANIGMDVPASFETPQANLGVFHESNLQIFPRLTLTLGLRYDLSHVKVDYDTQARMAVDVSVMGKEATSNLVSHLLNNTSNTYNQLLPKLAMTYQLPQNKGNIYASLSKGYRAGGYNIQMFSDILQTDLQSLYSKGGADLAQSQEVVHSAEDYQKVKNTITYKPEESWNMEAGTHLNLFDGSMQADFSAFYMQIRNQQLSVMATGYGYGRMMVNAGKSYSCGIEASLRGYLAGGRLRWTANYGLNHAVFKEYVDGEGASAVDYSDNKVPYIPMHTLGASAIYRFPLGSGQSNYIDLGADVTAQGRTYWDEANTYSQSMYALLGLHATLKMANHSLRLYCRNLTNTHYATFAFDSEATGNKIYLAQRGTPIVAGVEWKISLK